MTGAATGLARHLERELEGEVRFDPFARGRYSTDASIYQVEPIGVVVPRNSDDIVRTIQIAADAGVPVIPRGAGTSQSGQTIGRALIVDTSKYLTNVLEIDPDSRRAVVEPGLVLDELNTALAAHRLVFPVDVATASRATLGGMAANNSGGARSLRYGIMVHNVRAIHAVLADGTSVVFGPDPDERGAELQRQMQALYAREADEIAARFPDVLRNVAGYNLDRLAEADRGLAPLLVGSEGTLAFFTRLDLELHPLPSHTVLAVCHFPTLRAAMTATRHIVALEPTAVELADRTLIDLASANPAFQPIVRRFLRGEPDALLLVEFAGPDPDALHQQLAQLDDLMGTLGHPNAVVPAADPEFQSAIWSVRRAGLNIVMSMRGDAKPISFIEDCAVPLDALAEYTDRLREVFSRHGTRGTFYAHASVGCLHVRPILNLKDPVDITRMRRIAEEAHAVVRECKGSHSGEHGDGFLRSEFLEPMLGSRIVRAFEAVKDTFDPTGLFNPGKIVHPPRMDDRSLFRYHPDYAARPLPTILHWPDDSGFLGAAEMCNNNGACRRLRGGVMCPSYRVTHDEEDTTRARANTLRLALTGQLGPDALTAPAMYHTMDLCVGCKGCRRECPTGVDMARMKIEILHHYRRQHGTPLRDRLIAYLPRYAPWAARVAGLLNAPHRHRAAARLAQRWIGFTADRLPPSWRRTIFRPPSAEDAGSGRPEVALWIDTFNTYFEPENAYAAQRVLESAGYSVRYPRPADGGRPLCCGRTFLNAGLVDEARVEGQRVLDALTPFAERGIPVIGLEPSCLLTVRDEFEALFPVARVEPVARATKLLEEFLVAERAVGRADLPMAPVTTRRVAVHTHCHQKAFGLAESVPAVLRWIPDLTVETIESGCCGMAGSFGYEREHYEISMKMAELDLLPAIRRHDPETWLVADGTSCRHQIEHGTGRSPMHAVRVLDEALKKGDR